MVNILVTVPQGPVFDTFFNEELKAALANQGHVTYNPLGRQYTPKELAEALAGQHVLVTGWGTPVLTGEVLKNADVLRMVAHTGGSVKPYVTDEVYDRGIAVVSGNNVFALSVAEGVIAYALAALRDIPRYSTELQKGIWPPSFNNKGLLDRKVGLVGYGMIAGYVVDMLKPFSTPISVFSRHLKEEVCQQKGLTKASLEEIFATCDVVSIHSGMTAENYHLITRELLESMKPGALLINTARGAIIDEEALIAVLHQGNITAALDVYEQEPLPADHPLMSCPNTLLMPHMGGPTIDRRLAVTRQVIGDIGRFFAGEALMCPIDRAYANKMSTI